jgi:glycosyltransferase involved in cell wall biosynthesis
VKMVTRQIDVDNDAIPSLHSAVDGDFITVVLPCLNEEASVALVVTEALQALEGAGLEGEVLVVDNGSEDSSAEAARMAGARVIVERRRGYGRALRTGIAEAKGSVVVMADADWTYDMTKIPLLVAPVLAGRAEIAIGSRLHEANGGNMPVLHRLVGTPVLTALVRRAGGNKDLADSQSGFRCFRKESIRRLQLNSDGMEFASEMLIKGSHNNLRIQDVPTGYRKRIGVSKLNTLSDGWRHLRLILLLAPEQVLVAPGTLLFLVGVILSGAAFFPPQGIEIGSLRWQPIFFSAIAVVLGLQALLIGLTFVWRRSAITGAPIGHGLSFIRNPAFPRACSLLGLVMLLTGFGLDAFLFVKWVNHGGNGFSDLPIASLGQSLLLAGGSLGSFGLVVMWLHWDERQNRPRG